MCKKKEVKQMKRLVGKRIYMLGIGGVSMSSLAIMLKQRGFFVSGSDERQGQGTDILAENNIEVDFQLNEDNIRVADLIVASSAIKEDDLHLLLAKRYAKEIWTRGELLGFLSDQYEKVIAVAGSHGKTTTTAMIFEILKTAGKNPTLHLGGYRVENGKNFHLGEEEYFVTEACEYHDNFLNLHPYLSVVTNVEKEHMDYFHSFTNQKKSFKQFIKQSTFVVKDFAGIKAKDIRHDKNGGLMFSFYKNGKKFMDLHMHICEEINTQNCVYAYLVAKKLGFCDGIIKQGLENFKGVGTRFERVVCPRFDTVICDYAHHPTELKKAIATAKHIFKNKQLVTIFQPHTFSRTKNLLADFVNVFKDLPCPLFFKTYSAREKPEEGLSALQLTQIIEKHNKMAEYFETFEDLENHLNKFSKSDTVLLFLGAGDLPNILHKKNFLA